MRKPEVVTDPGTEGLAAAHVLAAMVARHLTAAKGTLDPWGGPPKGGV